VYCQSHSTFECMLFGSFVRGGTGGADCGGL
jgi:hypothetical protein